MEIKDLKNYNFHDSGLLNIEKNKDFIKLTILFCLYDQEDYIEGQPEHAIVKLTFKNIINSEIPDKEFHNDEIIDTKINGNNYIFGVQNSYSRDYYMVSIEAESVEFNTVQIIEDLGKFYDDNNL